MYITGNLYIYLLKFKCFVLSPMKTMLHQHCPANKNLTLPFNSNLTFTLAVLFYTRYFSISYIL